MKLMRLLTVAGMALLAVSAVSCGDKGTAEKVGEKIDQGMEKAGEKMEEGAAKVQDKIDDALDNRPGEPALDAAERAQQ